MLNLNRTISVGREKILFGVYSDPIPGCPEVDDVVGVGSNFTEAIEDFLSQVPEHAYVNHGEDWDDPHEFIDTSSFELSSHVSVNHGEYLCISK